MKDITVHWGRRLAQAALALTCSGVLCFAPVDAAHAAAKRPRGGGLSKVPPLTPLFNKHARPHTNGGGGKPGAAPKPKGWDPPPPKRGF